jgi:hypothetical protein
MPSTFASGRGLVAIIFIWMASSSVQAGMITSCVPALNSCDPGQLLKLGNFGYPPASQTFGETITVPLTDNVLTSFSFEMMLPTTIQLRGYVFEWDGTKAEAGTELFASDPVHTTDPNSFQMITFNTSGIKPLTAGDSYVLFASTVGAGSDFGFWGRPRPLQSDESLNFYSGGEFVFINSGDSGDWVKKDWMTSSNNSNPLGAGGDVAFSATFVSETKPVPEPGSLPLIGGAAIAVAAVANRRRRK